jgi:hypothetical protein
MNFEEFLKQNDNLIKIISKGDDSVAQEIRIKLWENFNQFDESKQKFQTGWINKVAKNVLIDLNRHSNRNKRVANKNTSIIDENDQKSSYSYDPSRNEFTELVRDYLIKKTKYKDFELTNRDAVYMIKKNGEKVRIWKKRFINIVKSATNIWKN